MNREKSRLRKDVEDLGEKRKLHRSLTKICMNVHKALRSQNMNYEELEKEIGRHDEERPGEWMQRMLGGGINLSLRTIFKLEEALGVELIATQDYEWENSEERDRRRKE